MASGHVLMNHAKAFIWDEIIENDTASAAANDFLHYKCIRSNKGLPQNEKTKIWGSYRSSSSISSIQRENTMNNLMKHSIVIKNVAHIEGIKTIERGRMVFK